MTRNLTAILLLGLLAACSHAPPNATAAAAPATPAAQTPGTAPTPAITPLRPATPTPPSAVAQVAGSSPAVAAGSTTADAAAPLKPPAPPGSPPVLKTPAPPLAAAPPQAAAPRQAPAPPRAPAAAPQPAAVAASPPAALNLASLEQRLRDTRAIGVFTKLSLKNQVDDLLDQFRALYRGQVAIPLAALRQRYDLLMLKVLSLLQDSDPPLANDIVASREAIWGILRDPAKFATIS